MRRRISSNQLAAVIVGNETPNQTDIVLTGVVATGYSSGLVPVKLDSESTAGTKGFPIIKPYTDLPVAADKIALVRSGSSFIILGKIVTPSAFVDTPATDALAWRGYKWMEVGATVLASSNTEVSTTSTSYTTVKAFYAPRPGKYRFVFDIHRTSPQTAQAQIAIITPGSFVIADASTSSSSTGYESKTLDMTKIAYPGSTIALQLKTSNASGAGFIQNCSLRGIDATGNLTPTYEVLLLNISFECSM